MTLVTVARRCLTVVDKVGDRRPGVAAAEAERPRVLRAREKEGGTPITDLSRNGKGGRGGWTGGSVRGGGERSSIPLFRDLGKRGAYVYSRITRSFGEARYPINAIVKGVHGGPALLRARGERVVIAIYGGAGDSGVNFLRRRNGVPRKQRGAAADGWRECEAVLS